MRHILLFLYILCLAWAKDIVPQYDAELEVTTSHPLAQDHLTNLSQRITHVFVTNITLVDPAESRQQEEYARLQSRLQRPATSGDASHPRQRLLTALHAFHRYKERNLAETKRWRDWYKKIPKRQRSVCAPVKLLVFETNEKLDRRIHD